MNTRTFGAVCLLSASSWAAAADKVPIKLDRLPKAGNIIEVASSTELTGDVGVVLARPKRHGVTGAFKMVANLVIRIRIDEVDAAGWTTKAAYQIVRCDATSSLGRVAADLPGKVFQVSVADGKRLYLEPTGQPGENYVLDEPRAGMLDVAVPIPFLKGEPGLDALFGTAEPQEAGSTWNADPKVLARGFAPIGAAPERAGGASVLKKGKGKLLTVESKLQLTGLKYELPAGYTLIEDKFQLQFSSVASPDASLLPAEQAIVRYTSLIGNINGIRSQEWIQESGRARYRLIK